MARGSISPYGPPENGRWRVRVYSGVDPVTGGDRYLTKVVDGIRAAEDQLAEFLHAVATGRHADTTAKTLGDALDAWLVVKAMTCEETTMDNYRTQVKYVPDRLRKMSIGKVTVEHLEAFYAHLFTDGRLHGDGGIGTKAIINVHRAIYAAFELARRRGWVKYNPARDAEKPKGRKRNPTPAPVAHLATVFAFAAEIDEALAIYLGTTLATGGRRGEMHGLRWSGIDLEAGKVTFRDVIAFVKGKGWIVKPRTKSGEPRTVRIDPATVDQLRVLEARAFTWALEAGTALPPSAFVFSDSPTGATFWNPNTTQQRFARAAAEAGVPELRRPHDLRHLAATHLIDQGMPIPGVSNRLGHRENSTTLDLYTAWVPQSDERAAEIMGELLATLYPTRPPDDA